MLLDLEVLLLLQLLRWLQLLLHLRLLLQLLLHRVVLLLQLWQRWRWWQVSCWRGIASVHCHVILLEVQELSTVSEKMRRFFYVVLRVDVGVHIAGSVQLLSWR